MKLPITPNQVNLQLSDALSHIMNKGKIKKAGTAKVEMKKIETVLETSISCNLPLAQGKF